jgi:general secretion pathway protein E
VRVAERGIDIRVSTVPTVFGESLVLRLLDRSRVFLDLATLGFAGAELAAFERLIRRPYGMLLVTGPTGSGKTTTLYAVLDRLNSPEKKIVTIEDPVEYQLTGINQIQVHPKIGLTFASGLRSIVRQDPDVILVGEIRDRETADIAIQSALTGHLVFSTVHTNDAAGAVTRLEDMGVESFLIASAVMGIMAQRLVRRVCPDCSAPAAPDAALLRSLGADAGDAGGYRAGRGCENCNRTGFRGRLGIFELLPLDDAIRALVLERASAGAIREAAVRAGMRTMRRDGLEKAARGLTTIAEVLRATQEE